MKAYWLWRWSITSGLPGSRDEFRERVGANNLTEDQKSLWVAKAKEQKIVMALCAAASQESPEELKVRPVLFQ